jgi:hypothetical protein
MEATNPATISSSAAPGGVYERLRSVVKRCDPFRVSESPIGYDMCHGYTYENVDVVFILLYSQNAWPSPE